MEGIHISKDKRLIDISYIHTFLTKSYWAKGRTKEEVILSMENCTCYGVYVNDQQIGFARILTDQIVFAYIMDVFIDPAYRGKGYSKRLMDTIHSDTDLLRVKTWYLKTGDAHGLYRQFGYDDLGDVGVWMERKKDKDAPDPNRIV